MQAIDQETDQRETEFEELPDQGKRSVLYAFLEISETLKAVEKEKKLDTEDLPVDRSNKWRLFRNRIAHDPIGVQDKPDYVQRHIEDLSELDAEVDAYWTERVEEEYDPQAED